mgnify:CR=1 FL=1
MKSNPAAAARVRLTTTALTLGLASVAIAQTTQNYSDATGEVAVPGNPYPHLDITSVDVTVNAAEDEITFRINLDGDPVATNWGNYMIGIRSAGGGDTSGNGWGRPIEFTPGMTRWIGCWVNDGGSVTGGNGQIWTYAGASWNQTGSLNGTNGTVTPDAAGKYVEIVTPTANLDLGPGEVFAFDVYTSGGGGGDGAVDSLSASATSIGNWPDSFTTDAVGGAPNPALEFTMPGTDPFVTWIQGFGLAPGDQGEDDDPDMDNLTNREEFDADLGLNPNDPDTDGDNLDDDVETGTGTYVSVLDTGSLPADDDTDDDGYLDGVEVDGTALGYLSDPNEFNHDDVVLAGTFLTPSFDPTGNGLDPLGTDGFMTPVGTGLTEQYQWMHRIQLSPTGNYSFKFTNGLDWADPDHWQWGANGSPNQVVRNGSDIEVSVPLSGIHDFAIDTANLTYSVTRATFPDLPSFLAAYGLASGGDDDDSDNLDNSEEFALGTDPTNPDTDGDGLEDGWENNTGTWLSGTQTGTDPLDADSDDDTLSDGIESNSGTFNGAGDPGTNPNEVDSDGDGENDNIEIFQGTDPTDINDSSASNGLPLVDGTKDSLYGSFLARQTIQTNFGDNINELNAAYGKVVDGKLYLMLTGNLGDNFNKLEVFIDSTDDVTDNTFISAGNDGASAMDDMLFDTEFTPEYHIILRRGLGKFDVDFADLGAGTWTAYEAVLNQGTEGFGTTGVGVNTLPINVAYNNSNTGGVGGGTGAADQAAAAAAIHGIEICIDLVDLGSPVAPMKVMAAINNDNHSFLSNQILGGLPVDLDGVGLGTNNLGDPSVVEFDLIDQDQFFPVALTTPNADFSIKSTTLINGGTQLEIEVGGLTNGTQYVLRESADLSGFGAVSTTVTPAASFLASGTTQTLVVDLPVGDKRFYRVEEVTP